MKTLEFEFFYHFYKLGITLFGDTPTLTANLQDSALHRRSVIIGGAAL